MKWTYFCQKPAPFTTEEAKEGGEETEDGQLDFFSYSQGNNEEDLPSAIPSSAV